MGKIYTEFDAICFRTLAEPVRALNMESSRYPLHVTIICSGLLFLINHELKSQRRNQHIPGDLFLTRCDFDCLQLYTYITYTIDYTCEKIIMKIVVGQE